MTLQDVAQLSRLAAKLRLNVVRMMGANKAHHFGGSLSAAASWRRSISASMRFDPAKPKWPSVMVHH
jgi:transketolase N-terminal domain/subunit